MCRCMRRIICTAPCMITNTSNDKISRLDLVREREKNVCTVANCSIANQCISHIKTHRKRIRQHNSKHIRWERSGSIRKPFHFYLLDILKHSPMNPNWKVQHAISYRDVGIALPGLVWSYAGRQLPNAAQTRNRRKRSHPPWPGMAVTNSTNHFYMQFSMLSMLLIFSYVHRRRRRHMQQYQSEIAIAPPIRALKLDYICLSMWSFLMNNFYSVNCTVEFMSQRAYNRNMIDARRIRNGRVVSDSVAAG